MFSLRTMLGLCLIVMAVEPSAGQPLSRRFLNRPLAQWSRELNSPDPSVRRSAAFVVGKYGMEGAPFVPALMRLLADSEPSVREAAAFAIGEIGLPAARQAEKELRRVLAEDRVASVRRAAAYALGQLGTFGTGAAATLRRALRDPDPRVRQNAAWALGNQGETSLAEAVSDLAVLLRDDDVLVRRDTARALSRGGAAVREAVPALIAALDDPHVAVRQNVVMALGHIGPDAKAAMPKLLTLLRRSDTDSDVRREAFFAVCRIGGDPLAEAIDVLQLGLADSDPRVREVSAAALVNLKENARPAIGDLTRALKDSEVRVRRNAALALANCQPAPEPMVRPHVPAWLAVLREENDPQVKLYLAWTMLNLRVPLTEFPQARSLLIRLALDRESAGPPIVRYEFARVAVIHFGAKASEVTPTLIENLQDESIGIVEDATAKSNVAGGEQASGTTSVDQKGEGDGRVLAARALGILGRAAGERAKKALEQAARDPNSSSLRQAAKEALDNFK